MFQDKQMKIIIKLAIPIFIVLVIFLIYITSQKNKLYVQEEKKPTLSLTTDSNIFRVDSILLYSSANALNNAEMQEDYWDLNLYQYTDMAIHIDNHVSISDSTQKNTVKDLYIDNISFSSMPKKGTPKLYFKDSTLFGTGVINEEKSISDRLNFNVISENKSDVLEPSFYADCSNPIILSSVNQEIVKNFVIRNTNSSITFDGNLLLDATILLSTIEYEVTFTIHIVNYLDEEYLCEVVVPITLGDENDINTIYDGSYTLNLSDLNYRFYKMEV